MSGLVDQQRIAVGQYWSLSGTWTYEQVSQDIHSLYLFGENSDKYGTNYKSKRTQAIIRGLPNAHGIITCAALQTPWPVDQLSTAKARMDRSFVDLLRKVSGHQFTRIVISNDGLGTGAAKLESNPELANYLLACLRRSVIDCAPHLRPLTIEPPSVEPLRRPSDVQVAAVAAIISDAAKATAEASKSPRPVTRVPIPMRAWADMTDSENETSNPSVQPASQPVSASESAPTIVIMQPESANVGPEPLRATTKRQAKKKRFKLRVPVKAETKPRALIIKDAGAPMPPDISEPLEGEEEVEEEFLSSAPTTGACAAEDGYMSDGLDAPIAFNTGEPNSFWEKFQEGVINRKDDDRDTAIPYTPKPRSAKIEVVDILSDDEYDCIVGVPTTGETRKNRDQSPPRRGAIVQDESFNLFTVTGEESDNELKLMGLAQALNIELKGTMKDGTADLPAIGVKPSTLIRSLQSGDGLIVLDPSFNIFGDEEEELAEQPRKAPKAKPTSVQRREPKKVSFTLPILAKYTTADTPLPVLDPEFSIGEEKAPILDPDFNIGPIDYEDINLNIGFMPKSTGSKATKQDKESRQLAMRAASHRPPPGLELPKKVADDRPVMPDPEFSQSMAQMLATRRLERAAEKAKKDTLLGPRSGPGQ